MKQVLNQHAGKKKGRVANTALPLGAEFTLIHNTLQQSRAFCNFSKGVRDGSFFFTPT